MSIKARIRKLEQALLPTESDVREMTDEQLMRIIGCSPVQNMTDAELLAIIVAEKSKNGHR